MPEHIEAGTVNSHSIAGLKAGLEFIQKTGISKIREKENMLVDLFYNSIKILKILKYMAISLQRTRSYSKPKFRQLFVF